MWQTSAFGTWLFCYKISVITTKFYVLVDCYGVLSCTKRTNLLIGRVFLLSLSSGRDILWSTWQVILEKQKRLRYRRGWSTQVFFVEFDLLIYFLLVIWVYRVLCCECILSPVPLTFKVIPRTSSIYVYVR